MVRMLGIEEDAPASGAVAPSDALILVDRIEELRGILGIDGVFDGNHDRPLFRLRLNKHSGFAPMIPVSQIERLTRQRKREAQQQACRNSRAGQYQRSWRAAMRRGNTQMALPAATLP